MTPPYRSPPPRSCHSQSAVDLRIDGFLDHAFAVLVLRPYALASNPLLGVVKQRPLVHGSYLLSQRHGVFLYINSYSLFIRMKHQHHHHYYQHHHYPHYPHYQHHYHQHQPPTKKSNSDKVSQTCLHLLGGSESPRRLRHVRQLQGKVVVRQSRPANLQQLASCHRPLRRTAVAAAIVRILRGPRDGRGRSRLSHNNNVRARVGQLDINLPRFVWDTHTRKKNASVSHRSDARGC